MKNGDVITITQAQVKHKGQTFLAGNYSVGNKISIGLAEYFLANGWAITTAEDAPETQAQAGNVTIEPDNIEQKPQTAKVT